MRHSFPRCATPLDDRRAELWRATTNWGDPRNKERYVYRPPVDEIRMSTAPSLNNRTYTITADIERDTVFDAVAAREYGLVDHIIKSRKASMTSLGAR